MSRLCGAWTLSGRPVSEALAERDRLAMLGGLPGEQADLTQLRRGPLWLAAPSGLLSQDGLRCLAAEGFLAFGDGPPRDLFGMLAAWRDAGEPPRPCGHYVLAAAEPGRRRLELLRDPTGGERLYYARAGDLLLFASSLRPLFAHSAVSASLEPGTALEQLLNEQILFGDRTLYAGIHEVFPGHRLAATDGAVVHERLWELLPEPRRGSLDELAGQLRRSMRSAVRASIGDDRQAAVFLSGGIDSSSIAALAAELLGPENVRAFTFEFEDPAHPSETHFAAAVCRRLGIRHHVLKISFQDHLRAVPETFWRLEDVANITGATDLLLLARRASQEGFRKALTGFGTGGHMAYLMDLARILEWLPSPDRALRYWRASRAGRNDRWRCLGRLHPGLEPPFRRLYYPILCILRHNGLIRDVAGFYPPALRPLVEAVSESERVRRAVESARGLSLHDQFRWHCLLRLNSHRRLWRTQKLLREAGVIEVNLTLFPECAPWTIFPTFPRPLPWHPRRRMRPGKYLLQRAMQDALPEAILSRPKLWRAAAVSEPWREEVLRRLRPWSSSFVERLRLLCPRELGPAAEEELGSSLIPFASLQKLVLERPGLTAPPTLEDLESGA